MTYETLFWPCIGAGVITVMSIGSMPVTRHLRRAKTRQRWKDLHLNGTASSVSGTDAVKAKVEPPKLSETPKQEDEDPMPSRPDLTGLSPVEQNEKIKAYDRELATWQRRRQIRKEIAEEKKKEEAEKKKKEEEGRRGTWEWYTRLAAALLFISVAIFLWVYITPFGIATLLADFNAAVIGELIAVDFDLDEIFIAYAAYEFGVGMIGPMPTRHQAKESKDEKRRSIFFILGAAILMGFFVPWLLYGVWFVFAKGWPIGVSTWAALVATMVALLVIGGARSRKKHWAIWPWFLLAQLIWALWESDVFGFMHLSSLNEHAHGRLSFYNDQWHLNGIQWAEWHQAIGAIMLLVILVAVGLVIRLALGKGEKK